MSLQNRVDPFGMLCANNARGLFMGNRGGRFHNSGKSLGSSRYVSRRWIICLCEFKGRQRDVWGDSYTELFFLDEVTALAAGHRPCFECRRTDAKAFMSLFPFAPDAPANVESMDRQLHAERLHGRVKRRHHVEQAAMPDGAMYARDDRAFALRNKRQIAWSHCGYDDAGLYADGVAEVLTPPSIVEVLRRGYAPVWHSTAAPIPQHP